MHLQKLTNAWQQLWANAANRDVINFFIDIATKILELINNTGLLQSAFVTAFSGAMIRGIMSADSWLVKFVKSLDAARDSSKNLGDVFNNLFGKQKNIENKETIFKGLDAINKNREEQKTIPTAPQDFTDVAAKDAKANASQRAAIAAKEEAASEKQLSAANNENSTSEMTEIVTKEESIAASNQATQANIQEAESAEVAAQSIRNKAEAEREAAAMEVDSFISSRVAEGGMGRKSKKRLLSQRGGLIKEVEQFNQDVDGISQEMAEASMDWSLAYVGGFENIEQGAAKVTTKIVNDTGQIRQQLTGIDSQLTGLSGALVGLATNPMTWLIAIPALIGFITHQISLAKQEQQDLIDKAHESTNVWNENKENIATYSQKYKDLKTQLTNVNLTEQERVDINNQLFDLQKQITSEYGKEAEGVNLVNGELEEQLRLLTAINVKQAKKDLASNNDVYREAEKAMTTPEKFQINAFQLDESQVEQVFGGIIDDAFKQGNGIVEFEQDALKAEKTLQNLFDRLYEIKESMSEGEWANSGLQWTFASVESNITSLQDKIKTFKDDYMTKLEKMLYADQSGRGLDIFNQLKGSLEDYNTALTNQDDIANIEEKESAYKKALQAANDYLQISNNAQLTPLFEAETDKLNETLLNSYNITKQMRSEQGKSAIESVFGTVRENKKLSKEVQNSVLEAAENILLEQKKMASWGYVDSSVNPFSGGAPAQTKFGNIDMNDRQVIQWTKDKIEKYKQALASWDYMPEVGGIDTVFGGSTSIGEVELAFSPILQTENGAEFLSKEAVIGYLEDVISAATDQTGKIDLDEIIAIDANPKKGIGGKKLIASVNKIGDEAGAQLTRTIGTSLHFFGKKGAITLGMNELAKAAKDANIPVSTIINSLKQSGSLSGLQAMLSDTAITADQVRAALLDTDSAIAGLASSFGITMYSPEEDINTFINNLIAIEEVVSSTSDSSQNSLDEFFADVTSKIEKISSLTSIVQKGVGQTGLTFGIDEAGNLVDSEVTKIINAYKNLEGYDLGSLFAETATGIKLNMDAYRALAAEEEAETKRRYKLERASLENQMLTATPEQKSRIQQQITELDMLSSAYDGATSALAKYLNQQNAADYGDTYAALRDIAIKRGNELNEKGMIGTEEFRSIAQLFSFGSLATADAAEVQTAYENGLSNVKKYFTEDAVDGVWKFLDDVSKMGSEFSGITKEIIDGEEYFIGNITDEQVAKLAEHLGVSVDLVESFFDQIKAIGGNVDIYRNGGFDSFKKLDEQINNSRDKLKELKDAANDPNLIPDDIFNFNAEDLDTLDDMRQEIKTLEDLKITLPADPEAYKVACELIDQLKQKVEEYEKAADEARNTSPVTTEDYDKANEYLTTMEAEFEKIKEASANGLDFTVNDDGKLQQIANQIVLLPDTIQEYMDFIPSSDPEEIKRQMQNKLNGIPVEVNVQAEMEGFKNEVDSYLNGEQYLGIYELPVQSKVDNSEVDEVKEDLKEGVETGVTFTAENTVQDVANSAGVGQGVNTVNTQTINQVTNEQHNISYNADTSGIETANSAAKQLKSVDDSSIKMSVSVEGIETVENAEDRIKELVTKSGSKVTINIGSNVSIFNKNYAEVMTKLNALINKDITPKIKADNSDLKNKVQESKDKLNTIHDKPITITAKASGLDDIKKTYDAIKDKKITITTEKKTITTTSSTSGGKGKARGTAHAAGTVMYRGHAYVNGTDFPDKWKLKQNENGALVNELGAELISDTRTGEWYILNNGDPTFTNLRRGQIVFNADQTSELLETGKIKGSHGKLIGGGFATGTTKWNGKTSGKAHADEVKVTKPKPASTSSSNDSDTKKKKTKGGSDDSSSSSSSKKAKDFLQTLDAIEIQLKRIDALVSRLDTNAAKTYTSFTSRFKNVNTEVKRLRKEIELINDSLTSKETSKNYLLKAAEAAKQAGLKEGDEGYNKDSSGAAGKALSDKWIKRIQNTVDNGSQMTINDVSNEGLWKKIQAYQTWYEKHVNLQQKKEDYLNKLSQLTIQKLQLVQTKYETLITSITTTLENAQKNIDLNQFKNLDKTNKKGKKINTSDNVYFSKIYKQYDNLIKKNKEEQRKLRAQLDAGVKNGAIKKNSEEWLKWTNQIKTLDNSIVEAQTNIGNTAIQQLENIEAKWQLVLDTLAVAIEGYENKIDKNNYTDVILKKDGVVSNKKDNTKKAYDSITAQNRETVKSLKSERAASQKQLDKSVKEGRLEKGSAKWKEEQNKINSLSNDILAKEAEISEAAVKQLENIQAKWEAVLGNLDSINNKYKEDISSQQYKSFKGDKTISLNNNIAANNREELNYLEQEAKELEEQLKTAVDNKQIKKGSKEWLEQVKNINEIQVKITEKQNEIAESAVANLEYIQSKYETYIKTLNSSLTRLQNIAKYNETKGYDNTVENLTKQISIFEAQKDDLAKESASLQKYLDDAVKAGTIQSYSEEWYKWYNQIQDVNNELISTSTDIEELNNQIRELEYTKFERLQEIMSDVADEMNFIKDLFFENQLFDDEGHITNEGLASEALIAQQYDMHIKLAEEYGKAVKKLNAQIANDPNNQNLIKKRNEYLKLQREAISNAHQEMQAQRDLIEKGIQKQIQSLNELVRKYQEVLNAQRTEQSYAESIAQKQKTINSLQKQLDSMNGDDSEEGRARRQQLQDQLKEARKDLEDTQEDKRVNAITEALSDMQEKFSDTLNKRLDDVEGLFNDTISSINNNSQEIVDTIKNTVSSVGYTISDTLSAAYQKVAALVSSANSTGTIANKDASTTAATNNSSAQISTTPTKSQVTGWINNNKQYIDPATGGLAKGLKTINGKTYYFDSSGTYTTGLQTVNNKKYYFDSTGAAKTGTFVIGSKTYTADNTGAITFETNTTPSTSTPVIKKEEPVTSITSNITGTKNGLKTEDGKKYYYENNKKLKNVFKTIGGKTYYFGSDGAAVTGLMQYNKAIMFFDNTGVRQTGWRTINNKKYYFNPSNSGHAVTGWQKIDGKKYYFSNSARSDERGVMQEGRGFVFLDGMNYYLESDGSVRIGDFNIGSSAYHTSSSGAVIRKDNKPVVGKLAKGTPSVKIPGIYQVNEEGEEIFINSKGKIYTKLDKGTTVLPHKAAVNLLEGMSDPIGFITKNLDSRPSKTITTTNNTSGNSTNYITFNLPNVTNYKEFMREAQNDPNFTKYIQEISLGKLNGNNSLKKNSIRFN